MREYSKLATSSSIHCPLQARVRFPACAVLFFGKNEEGAAYACLSIVRFGFTIIVTIVEFRLGVDNMIYFLTEKKN